MRRFEGYAALVTGAGRGIGEAVARRLAGEGARVLMTDVDAERVEQAAADVDGAEAWACDVGDRAAVEAAVARAVEAFGRLDVLVNNAYSCHQAAERIEDESDEAWERDLDTTLTGAFRCARAALPHLAAVHGRGAVVNIGSVNGLADFGNHAYSAAKAGLGSLTRTLAGEAAPRGVRVNMVAPGTIHTDAWQGREDALERAGRVYPLRRVGRPEDVAAAVAYLASSDASWVTGVTLPVDGGILGDHHAFREAVAGDR